MQKTILSEDIQSACDILLNIIDNINANKVIYLPIYVEPCFKLSILSYKVEHFIHFKLPNHFLDFKF